MPNRRTFITKSAVVSAGLMLHSNFGARFNSGPTKAIDPTRLKAFVDALPLPAALAPAGAYEGLPLYEVSMSATTQRLHRNLPPTYLWTYNGTFPGPTIEARSHDPFYVRWINRLPTKHFLPVDKTLHGAEGNPEVRTAVHVHGAHLPAASDGGPDDWFCPGESTTLYYPNNQQAAPLWYHDHAIGITRLNVYAGLAGLYLLRDSVEDALELPAGPYEVPLVIQDRMFHVDGSLYYPVSELPISPEHPGPWMPEFFGNVVLVNGKVWPYLEVEPRKYRLRIYNGSNARFYNLALSSGQPFFQIGAEGGLFAQPAILDHILLAPAERADVVVDFSGRAGQSIVLTNDASAPYPDGDPVDAGAAICMQFKVKVPLSSPDRSQLPPWLRSVPPIPETSIARVRDIGLREFKDEDEDPILAQLGDRDWDDPVTENPVLGTNEIWRFINATGDAHPIHLHLVQFQVLDRQPFDVPRYLATREVVPTGAIIPPDANERGWKDTVRVNPGELCRIAAEFTDYPGRFVYHCHILEHEDNEMMRPFEVVSA